MLLRQGLSWFFVALLCNSLAAAPVRAVTVHLPGYSATPLVNIPASTYSPSDIALDADGNLYVPAQPNGIYRVTPAGGLSLWSTVHVSDLTRLDGPEGYGAGRDDCRCIQTMTQSGLASPLVADGRSWTWVLLAPDGTLYANIWAGTGAGLYEVNRSTGATTPLVEGTPGPGGAGNYWDMAIGADGALYVLGSDGAVDGLYCLTSGGLTRVAVLPHAGIGLTLGPAGRFYTATTYGENFGEVWVIDPISGVVQLLASDLADPSGIAYDPNLRRLYVSEQGGSRTVYAIALDATPARPVSWGALKSRYR